MSGLIKLILALAEGSAAGQCRQTVVLMIAAAVFATSAMACALASLWIYLLPYAGDAGAPLVIALLLLVFCLTLLGIARARLRARPPSRGADLNPVLLLRETTDLLKSHKAPMLIAALLAGLVAGSQEK